MGGVQTQSLVSMMWSLSRTWCSELLLDDGQQTLAGGEARLGPGEERAEEQVGLLQHGHIRSHVRRLEVQDDQAGDPYVESIAPCCSLTVSVRYSPSEEQRRRGA